MASLKTLLNLAEQQVGYQEKASSRMLDAPRVNAGFVKSASYEKRLANKN